MSARTKESRIKIAFELISSALLNAEVKFPGWPDDVVHASAILIEEAGELTQAALDFFYGRYRAYDRMMKEAAQVGAMALRFLIDILGRIDEKWENPK